jgi:hypothetical protein
MGGYVRRHRIFLNMENIHKWRNANQKYSRSRNLKLASVGEYPWIIPIQMDGSQEDQG